MTLLTLLTLLRNSTVFGARKPDAKRINWADIPNDLLLAIANKLIETADFIRFGAVCSSWRSVYLETKMRLYKNHLMLLYNLSPSNTFHTSQVSIPQGRNLTYRGSSRGGWLVTESKEDNKIQLFNPFLSVNNEMHFPCVNHECFFKAVVNPSNSVVVAIACMHPHRLFFIKPGDKKWTLIPQVMQAHDIIYYRDKFYATRENGRVYAIDIIGTCANVVAIQKDDDLVGFCKNYIVESASGDLFLVSRITKKVMRYTPRPYNVTTNFIVCKMDSTSRWTTVESLGEHVLFLGDNTSVSLPATKVPGCISDCIYFTNDVYYKHMCKQDFSRHRDTGVFSLKDKSIKPLPLMMDSSIC